MPPEATDPSAASCPLSLALPRPRHNWRPPASARIDQLRCNVAGSRSRRRELKQSPHRYGNELEQLPTIAAGQGGNILFWPKIQSKAGRPAQAGGRGGASWREVVRFVAVGDRRRRRRRGGPGARAIQPRCRQVAGANVRRHLQRLPSQPAGTQADQCPLPAGSLYRRRPRSCGDGGISSVRRQRSARGPAAPAPVIGAGQAAAPPIQGTTQAALPGAAGGRRGPAAAEAGRSRPRQTGSGRAVRRKASRRAACRSRATQGGGPKGSRRRPLRRRRSRPCRNSRNSAVPPRATRMARSGRRRRPNAGRADAALLRPTVSRSPRIERLSLLPFRSPVGRSSGFRLLSPRRGLARRGAPRPPPDRRRLPPPPAASAASSCLLARRR